MDRFDQVRHLVDNHVLKKVLGLLHQLGVEPDVPYPVIAASPLRFHSLQEVAADVYLELQLPLLDEQRHSLVKQRFVPLMDHIGPLARPEFSVREGCRPIVVRCANEASEGQFLAKEIAALLKYKHYSPRDICVVARNNRYRELAFASLKAADIPVYLFRDPEAGEVSSDQNAVRISSLHGAKGHEFGTVFVAGVVEGVIPLQSAMDVQNVSSEAAVLYVGMTRARDLLYLSYSAADARGNPLTCSSFVDLIAQWCDFAEFRS